MWYVVVQVVDYVVVGQCGVNYYVDVGFFEQELEGDKYEYGDQNYYVVEN